MSVVFNKFFSAKFRDAGFLVSRQSVTVGGRKQADKIFPNSDKRNVEDLGKMRRDFSLTGIIRSPNYASKKNALVKALEQGGSGVLVHPIWGKVTVVARPYTLIESFNEIGRAVFEMQFSIVDKPVFPKNTGKSRLKKFLDAVSSSINDVLSSNFVTTFSENIAPALGYLNDVVDTLNAIKRTQANIQDGINAFEDSITTFQNKIYTFSVSATQLGASFNNLFNTLANVASNPTGSLNIFNDIFGFSATPRIPYSSSSKFGYIPLSTSRQVSGEVVGVIPSASELNTLRNSSLPFLPETAPTDIEINSGQVNLNMLQATTEIIKENNRNANTISLCFNLLALVQAYFAATNIDFESTTELDNISDELENRYQRLVDNDFVDGLLSDNEDVEAMINSLQDLRNEYRVFKDDTSVNLDKVITFNSPETPVSVLSYRLYGDLENEEKIAKLNDARNYSSISGALQVLTS